MITPSNQMECKYGERGSLTVYCINASAPFIKTSQYRYDHLDETLKCVHCNLERLEEGSFDIAGNQLKAVDIRNSSIRIIYKKAFIGLVFMEKLYLSNNPINEIYPGAFNGVRKVKYLEMENAVSQLRADVFRELVLLNFLILRNNNLTLIEDGTFEGLKNLKILDLTNNKLESVINIFKPLINLELLKLQKNYIKVINGNEFDSLSHLLGLFLDDNRLQKIDNLFSAQNQIRILSLASNNLTENAIKLGFFQNMNTLEELNLSLNMFTGFFPKFFSGLYSMRILNLHGNSISELSTGRFSGLPHLRSLNLSQNQITNVKPTGRLVLTNLHELDLSQNHIKSFDHISLIQRFPKLSNINLLNNNISCELYVSLKTFVENDNIHISVSDEIVKTCTISTKLTDLTMKPQIYINQGSKNVNSFVITMFILIIIIIILVSALFYMELIVLNKLRPSVYSVRIIST